MPPTADIDDLRRKLAHADAVNPWSYLRDVLDHLAVRSAGADLSDLLPDAPTHASSRLAA